MTRYGTKFAVALLVLAAAAAGAQAQKTISVTDARKIMGTNFFGIEEAAKYFGVHPAPDEIRALARVPFSLDTLRASRDSHILVAVFPLSIIEIRSKVDPRSFYRQWWYNKESFANDTGIVGWRLVRKAAVVDSTSKSWEEQQKILGENDETPAARVLVYAAIGHFLATGERLFEEVTVRTADADSDGNRVSIGFFDADGLSISSFWEGERGSGLGLSSARKSE
jgi:hypothetical protein